MAVPSRAPHDPGGVRTGAGTARPDTRGRLPAGPVGQDAPVITIERAGPVLGVHHRSARPPQRGRRRAPRGARRAAASDIGDARVLVLAGAGSAFCAGADLTPRRGQGGRRHRAPHPRRHQQPADLHHRRGPRPGARRRLPARPGLRPPGRGPAGPLRHPVVEARADGRPLDHREAGPARRPRLRPVGAPRRRHHRRRAQRCAPGSRSGPATLDDAVAWAHEIAAPGPAVDRRTEAGPRPAGRDARSTTPTSRTRSTGCGPATTVSRGSRPSRTSAAPVRGSLTTKCRAGDQLTAARTLAVAGEAPHTTLPRSPAPRTGASARGR